MATSRTPRPSRTVQTLYFAAALSLGACTRPAAPMADADADVSLVDDLALNDLGAAPTMDASVEDAVEAPADVPTADPWPATLPSSTVWGQEPGYRFARALIHTHSVHSHDACDNQPYVGDAPNEPCLQSFRRAICSTSVDVVFLTEHSAKMAEGPFERVMQLRAGDEPIREGAEMVGYWMQCAGAGAPRVLILPGAENELMPIALARHPEPLPGSTLVETYRAATDEAIARFHAADGFVVISHAEQKSRERTLSMRPDGIELYNMHANLDPRIAGPFLNVDIGAELAEVYRFRTVATRHDPNWIFLGIFRENTPDLVRLSDLWRDGQTVPGVAGSDAHENSIPAILADGERGDSYRRIFRWFSNGLLVRGELTRASALEALRQARARVMFEAWGVPVDFAWRAGGSVLADGATISLANGPVTLTATKPHMAALPRGTVNPSIRVRILRADAAAESGWTEVASSDGATVESTIAEPGIYRSEARITPLHAAAYLPRLNAWIHEVPWIYSAPTRIVP